MRKFSLLSKGIFNMQENRKRIIWTLLLATFVFHSILEDVIYPLQYFDEVIALLCFPLAGYHYFVKKRAIGMKVDQRPRRQSLVFW